MDFEEYRKRGKEMVDYIADYLQNIRSRRVFPDVSPGYMTKLVPSSAPEHGEKWDDVFKDVERVIMPGITHWQSPHMHAYFPALNSFPSLLGDMLADAIGCLGFTWASSPACTELETIVMDWLGKMIELPTDFLHSNEQTMGGGVIQTTASDATFVCLLAARSEAIRKFNEEGWDPAEINARLVGYCSDQAHSSVEKAGLIGLVKMRLLPSDDNLSLRGDVLQEAIDRDRDEGLIPFFLCATLGTTGACAFDNLKEVGPICEAEGLWMHIDAAYAGTAFVCPEYRKYMEGVDYAQSFAFNPSKWMMVHFDCTAMWVKNSGALHRTFNVEPLYLKHENSGAAIDYMHWQVPLSKRFRALKLWFVLRMFGVEGIRKHVRHGVRLAKKFEMMVRNDERFEVPAERVLGMVVFCLRDDNDNTEALLKRLNKSGRLHMVPAALKDKYVIRFTVTSQYTTDDDLERDWVTIRDTATRVLADEDEVPEVKKEILETAVPEKRQVIMRVPSIKRKDFGMSLILSNVPMSPKFINGSFAAIFDNNNIIVEFAKELSRGDFNGKTIMLSPRRRMKLKDQTKQQSLDCNLFAIRRSPGRFKQGSLDSKIDEILETSSYDSDTQSGLFRSDSVEENGCDAELKLGNAVKEHAEGVSQSQNGIHMICKHCGKPVED
ncbi:histidine decarboxylase-like [Haliotis rubra]|uniref:histidine decarboxylase-like n=1 Tax=Haliotis rubra TaxID=36100 RepID=UPI001EE542BB|nr:histidine decarboxylase-like [Haliotis rubra]